MAGTPPFRSIDTSCEKWSSYIKQIQFFFISQNVEDEKLKKAIFLSNVGSSTFCLIQTLIAPKDICNAEVKLDDIIKELDGHFDDSPNFMSATYEFYSCKQKMNQPLSEWIAELRKLAHNSGFTESQLKDKPLDRALRDAIWMGTNNANVRHSILKKKDPSFSEVLNIAKEGEMLINESEKLDKLSNLQIHQVELSMDLENFQNLQRFSKNSLQISVTLAVLQFT